MIQNNIYKFLFVFIIFASFCTGYGCKDKVDLPSQPIDSYSRVYMPEAIVSPIMKTFKITDSVQTLTYGANFGGQGYPGNDIPVTFTVDNNKVDSFNLVNKTNYAIMPAGSFQLSGNNAVIPKGQVNTTPLSVTFKTNGQGAMTALKTYLLPISIAGSSVKVNEALRTTFYVVKAQPDLKDYPNYNRVAWQIIGFSSQEANGEGTNNGRAIFALDGDPQTFWHTQWSGASPGPPHFLVIDMGAVITIHGLSFLARQADGGGKPNEVNIQVSKDTLSWIDAGTVNLQNNKDLQPQFLPNGFQSARYFKVIVNSAYNGSYTQIAELNAF